MLASCRTVWLIEATKYERDPLDDRTGSGSIAELAGSSDAHPRELQLFFAADGATSENSVVSIKNKLEVSVTAESRYR